MKITIESTSKIGNIALIIMALYCLFVIVFMLKDRYNGARAASTSNISGQTNVVIEYVTPSGYKAMSELTGETNTAFGYNAVSDTSW